MRVSISVIIIVAFVISSCAQDQKNQQKPTTKERSKSTSIQQVKMAVDGMVCSACQSNVKKTIKSFDGVTDVEVDLEKKFAFFTYDSSKVKPEEIQKAINDKGFTAGKVQVKKE